MTFITLWLYAALIILASMTLLWLVSLALKDSSIVDIFWGTGFVITFWATFALSGLPKTWSVYVLGALVTLWGLRLSLYILRRNLGKGEDFRYAQWREEHGVNWWWFSFFQVFLLQGFLMWIIAVPLVAAQFSGAGRFEWIAIPGAVLWLVGFIFEAGGDWQLARFKADPANKGKLLTTGLWGLTRHPNYFGDAVQWWGFYLFALANGGWWTIFSPILMTFLLLRVSGVAMLEKSLKDTKPGYEEYVENTPAFFPRLDFWNTQKESSK